jgi:ABC-2 type transport system ATP-binding protein
VRRILADVELRGLEVDAWEVRRPTLDDVFLTLTGRPQAAAPELQEIR